MINQAQSVTRRDELLNGCTFPYRARGKEGGYVLSVNDIDVLTSPETGTKQAQTMVDAFCCEVMAVAEQDPGAELERGGDKITAGDLAGKFWDVMVPR